MRIYLSFRHENDNFVRPESDIASVPQPTDVQAPDSSGLVGPAAAAG